MDAYLVLHISPRRPSLFLYIGLFMVHIFGFILGLTCASHLISESIWFFLYLCPWVQSGVQANIE